MRVKTPLMESDSRGRFGNAVVFGKGMGTNWARQLLKTPVVNSQRETLVKNWLSEGARAWGALSPVQMAGWCAYALLVTRYNSLGNPYHVSGQCEFINAYCLAANAGETLPTDAPVWEGLPAVPGFYGVRMPFFRALWMAWDTPSPGDMVEIFLTDLLTWSDGSPGPGGYRLEAFVDVSVGYYIGPSMPPYTAVFYKARLFNSGGEWGPWVYGSASGPEY